MSAISNQDQKKLLELQRLLKENSKGLALLAPDGSKASLPPFLSRALLKLAESLNTLQDSLIGTQEAAEFLGMSRPTFIHLLESGRIPYQQVANGKHRKVLLSDLVAYKQSIQRQTEAFENLLSSSAAFISAKQKGNPDRILRKIRTQLFEELSKQEK